MTNKLIQLLSALVLLSSSSVAHGQACSPADFTADGSLDFFDVSAFLTAFSSGDVAADLTEDGNLDFFDVSMFLTLFGEGCGPVEIVLRDSLNGFSTQGLGHLPIASNHPGYVSHAAFEITAASATTLSELQAVIANLGFPGTSLEWNLYDYNVYVWEDFATAQAYPTTGTLGTYSLPDLMEPASLTGDTTTTVFGQRLSYLIKLDLSSSSIQIPAGGTIVIGFSVEENGSSGLATFCESNEPGAYSDMYYHAGLNIWISATDVNTTLADGRLAVKVTGVAIP